MGCARLWKNLALSVFLWITFSDALMTDSENRTRREEKKVEAKVGTFAIVNRSARSSILPWEKNQQQGKKNLQRRKGVGNFRHIESPQHIQQTDKRFSFHLYGRNGQLEATTLSLNQVQAILLECSSYRSFASENIRESQEEEEGLKFSPHSRPFSNIQEVVATVQKMIAKETKPLVASSSSSSTTILKDSEDGESLENSEDILQSLHSVPEHIATQWQFLSTYSPSQITTSTLTLLNSSATTPLPTSANFTLTSASHADGYDSANDYSDYILQTEDIEENSGTFEMAVIEASNRDNSSPSIADTDERGEITHKGNKATEEENQAYVEHSGTTSEESETTTTNKETTEDYHSNPLAQLPNTLIPLGASTTTVTIDEASVTKKVHDNSAEDYVTTKNIISGTEEQLKEDKAKGKEDVILNTLTDLYAESFSSATTPLTIGDIKQKEEENDHTTEQPFYSTFLDFTSNVFSEESLIPTAVTPTNKGLTVDVSEDSQNGSLEYSSEGKNDTHAENKSTEENASNGVTIPYLIDNIVSIEIVDPVKSENPYDVMPQDGQGNKHPSVPSLNSREKENETKSTQQVGISTIDPYKNAALLFEILQYNNHSVNATLQIPEERDEGEHVTASSLLSFTTYSSSISSQLILPQNNTEVDKNMENPLDKYEENYSTKGDMEKYTEFLSGQAETYAIELKDGEEQFVNHYDQLPALQDLSAASSSHLSNTNSSSSVLPSSQLAPNNQQDKIDLEALQVAGDLTEGDTFYDYYGSHVYLDNVPEEYYEYYDIDVEKPQLNTTKNLGFPLPNATSPYHDHHHHHNHHHHHHDHGNHHDGHQHHGHHHHEHHGPPQDPSAALLSAPEDNPGLEASVEALNPDIRQFVDVINDITFRVYKRGAAQHRRQNFVMSPLNLISTLGMLLLGARGPSAGVLRELMQMDKFYTFNPHLVLKNVTEGMLGLQDVHDITFFTQFLVDMGKNPYSMEFFAKAIKVFYDADIEALTPSEFEQFLREKLNKMVGHNTKNMTDNFLDEKEPLHLTPPLSTVATSFLHARWNLPVKKEDLVDMSFIRFPTAERRLIQTTGIRKKMTVNAGFSRAAEATSVEVPLYSGSGLLSLVMIMPGEQKNFVANGLRRLEESLSSEKWSQVMRSMLPNTVNLKMPLFRHRAFHNFSGILSELGLEQLFQADNADFSGINHIKNLHLSDVVQLTEFQSCQIEGVPHPTHPSQRRWRERARNMDSFTREENTDDGAHIIHPPTYIYGLPMIDYHRERLTRMETRQGQGDKGGGDTEEIMNRRNTFDGVYDARTNESVALRSPATEVLRFEGSQTLSSSTSRLPQDAYIATITNVKKHTTVNVPPDTIHSAGEIKSPEMDHKDEKKKHFKEVKVKEAVEEINEDENYYYYEEYEHYNNYNYVYEDDATHYVNDDYDDDVAAENTNIYTPYTGKNKLEHPPDAEMQWQEESRVNREGIVNEEPGAHYRQSDEGTLAFDRAFLYAVRHNPTGLLLLLGRYIDPQAN